MVLVSLVPIQVDHYVSYTVRQFFNLNMTTSCCFNELKCAVYHYSMINSDNHKIMRKYFGGITQ